MRFKNFVVAIAVVASMAGVSFAQTHFAVPGKGPIQASIGPLALNIETNFNDVGNTVWDVGVIVPEQKSVAAELGFLIVNPEGGAFVDNLVNDAIRVDDSVNAAQFEALGLFDASNDSHWRDRGDGCCGFDTANPGTNPFTGEGIDGWFQSEDLTNIAVALGGGVEGMEPFGDGFLLPLIQLVTTGTDIQIEGLVAQDLRDSVGRDSWTVAQDSRDGRIVASNIPEPTTMLLGGLALVGMVALRRRS